MIKGLVNILKRKIIYIFVSFLNKKIVEIDHLIIKAMMKIIINNNNNNG